jgi:hypothetical protein
VRRLLLGALLVLGARAAAAQDAEGIALRAGRTFRALSSIRAARQT